MRSDLLGTGAFFQEYAIIEKDSQRLMSLRPCGVSRNLHGIGGRDTTRGESVRENT